MNIQLRSIWLKSIPYMLSVAGGITLFIVTKDEIHNASIADLINNISASLLSIPIVFLLYDYSNYRVSRKLNQTMATSMSSQVSAVLMGVIITIRQIIGVRGQLSLAAINKMQNMRPSEIRTRMKFTPAHLQKMRDYHTQLENLIYKYGHNNILDGGTMTNLGALSLELLHMINEQTFRRDRTAVAHHMLDIIAKIADWLDSNAAAAIDFQKLVTAARDMPAAE